MNDQPPVTEADLQAYVDAQLPAEQRRRIEDHLRNHPEAQQRVQAYRRMNEALHALYDPVLEEPLPEHLLPSRPPRLHWPRMVASVLWLIVGGALGWLLHPASVTTQLVEAPLQQHLVRPAAFAHSVYTTDRLRPVEIDAAEQQHLVAWLSERLHTPIQPPDLSSQGWQLIGGRLLPSTDRMAAQFMYQRGDGLRITLYTRRGAWENQLSAFQYARNDGMNLFYWVDGHLGHALVGALEQHQLLALSKAVQKQRH